MWERIEQWNREVEAEQLAVLRDPTGAEFRLQS